MIPENYGRTRKDTQAAIGRDRKLRETIKNVNPSTSEGTKTTTFSSGKQNDQQIREYAAEEIKMSKTKISYNTPGNEQRLQRLQTDSTTTPGRKKSIPEGPFLSEIGADSILYGKFDMKRILKTTLSDVRFVKNDLMVRANKVQTRKYLIFKFELQRQAILAQAFACITMFLIGAPLGSIIKRGGLGFPVLLSIFFFIIYYVFMMLGAKWAKNGMIYPFVGAWLPNLVLFPFGLFFLRQARVDARLFDTDFYNVMINKAHVKIREILKKSS